MAAGSLSTSSASGGGHLHAVGQLEAFDPGGQLGLGRMLLPDGGG